jgi:dynein heavy chain
MELTLGEQAGYKTDVENIKDSMITIFDAGINGTQSVPQIERGVVNKIFWKGRALLESVGIQEPHIVKMREEIEDSIMVCKVLEIGCKIQRKT